MPGEFAELIRRGFPSLEVWQVDRLEAHFVLLQKWNQVLNLTAVRDPEEAVRRHYVESLFLASHLPAGAWRIADVGSGAGFPGVPVAVYRPECCVVLIESHQRKAAFLKEATRGWSNVRVVAQRAESVLDEFDWVIARAVRAEDVVRLLVRFGGRLAFLGGADAGSVKGVVWQDRIAVAGSSDSWLYLSV